MINPTTPSRGDSLTLSYTWIDDDPGDGESGTEIHGYQNGVLIPSVNDSLTVDGTLIFKDDEWNVTVLPKDGTDFGSLVFTTFTVANTAPTVDSAGITPSIAYTTSTLQVNYQVTDIDGDTISRLEIRWFLNNVENSTHYNKSSISSNYILKGQFWNFTILVSDGIDNSSLTWSSMVEILNSLPEVINPSFNVTSASSAEDFIIEYTFQDDDDDDESIFQRIIYWFIDGIYNPVYDNKSIIYSENTTGGQFWYYNITVFDGTDLSIVYLSSGIGIGTVSNSVPVASNLEITPSNPTISNNLTANYDYFDADNHAEAGTQLRWYLNGQLFTAYNDSSVIPYWELVKEQKWHFTVLPSDGFEFGILVISANITINNTKPVVDSASITPSIVYTTSTLQVSYQSSDTDNDGIEGYEIRWYLESNNSEIFAYYNETTIPSVVILKDQVWNYSIIVFDGTDNSTTAWADSITVLNSIPSVSNPIFNQTIDIFTSTTFNISYTYIDVDPDDNEIITNLTIRWFINGIYNATKDNDTIVYAFETRKNQIWRYEIQVYDGEDYSAILSSINIEIKNSAPEIQGALVINPVQPKRGDSLTLSYNWTDDDQGDGESGSEIRWYQNGVLIPSLNDTLKVDGSLIIKDDQWNATVRPKDGAYFGFLIFITIIVTNTVPTVDSASITPSIAYTTSTLQANYQFSDIDDDQIMGFEIRWFLESNNSEIVTYYNETQIPSTINLKDQVWNYSIKVFDGTDNSSVVWANSITILNSIPQVQNPTFNQTMGIVTTTTFNISYTFLDLDINDNEILINLSIRWYINGIYNATKDNETIVNAFETIKGQFWRYEIEVYDGEAFSLRVSSPSIEIGNSAPILQGNLSITPNSPIRGDTLTLSYFWTDPDFGDSEIGTKIWWYKNGVLVPSLNDSILADGSLVIKDDIWMVKIVLSDGFLFSNAYFSIDQTIGNTKPGVVTVEILNEFNLKTDNDLIIFYDFIDVDSDTITEIQTQWFLDGAEQIQFENYTQINSTNTAKNQMWNVQIRVFDGLNWSEYKNLDSVITIRNSIPTISNIRLVGGSNSNENITVSYEYFDLDNDTESNTAILWNIIRGGSIETPPAGPILDSNFIIAGDIVYAIITPNDGFEPGITIITTLNSPKIIKGILIVGDLRPVLIDDPTIFSVNISSSFTVISDLYVNYTAYDPDSDSSGVDSLYKLSFIQENNVVLVFGAEYRWYKNGILTGYSDSFLSSEFLTKGDQWFVSVRVPDRYGLFSPWYNSSVITIENSSPEVQSVAWNLNEPKTSQDLLINYDFFDYNDDPEDLSLIRWYINGNEIIENENQSSLSRVFYSKGDQIFVLITPFDGEDYGITYNSSNFTGIIQIRNSIPIINKIEINGFNATFTLDSLKITWEYFDYDGDSEEVSDTIIKWYLDNAEVPEFANQTSIDPGVTSKDQRWHVIIRVFDGTDYSLEKQSQSIFIQNTPMTLAAVQINANQITVFSNESLVVNYENLDPDNDEILDIFILWYQNEELRSDLANLTIITSNELLKGDSWYFVLSANDGDNIWSLNHTSQTILVMNSVPILLNFEFRFENSEIDPFVESRDFYIEDEAISIVYEFIDNDLFDLDLSIIEWYRNETLQHDLTNQTVISSIETLPGDLWYVIIRPFDGETFGLPYKSEILLIESRPQIFNVGVENFYSNDGYSSEGLYNFWILTNDSRNEILEVEFNFTLSLNNMTISQRQIITESNGSVDIWAWSEFDLIQQLNTPYEFRSYLNSTAIIEILVSTQVTALNGSQSFIIYNSFPYSFTIEDTTPPRVVDANYYWNDLDNPTQLIFEAEIEEFGSEIDNVTLLYLIRPFSESLEQSRFKVIQNQNYDYNRILMSPIDGNKYQFILDFVPTENIEIIFNILVTDENGNINVNAYPTGSDSQNIIKSRFYLSPSPGFSPTFVLGVIVLTIISAIIFSYIGIRKFKSTEIVGFDVDLVIEASNNVPIEKIISQMNDHTLGVIIAVFHQTHGPLPIFVHPDILKDNIDKLIELSDRSFSSTRFVDDFTSEIQTNFDFTLSTTDKITSISYGYSLERSEMRGGAENITLNVL
ncbi:MAG: hypothetical protein ACXAD7_19135, partial [Candidatus Kariarchaeaceae archaeon]